MLQYCDFSLLHRRYFISQANSSFFLWDSVTCFASCKPFYCLGLISLGNYFINMNTNFTVKTNVVYLKFNMFRPPILPQVGSTHRPRRHEWRAKGLPQVWHQRHHQGTFPYCYLDFRPKYLNATFPSSHIILYPDIMLKITAIIGKY